MLSKVKTKEPAIGWVPDLALPWENDISATHGRTAVCFNILFHVLQQERN